MVNNILIFNRNYGLLSFGDEAVDDEDELEHVTKELKPKAKSAHDVGDPTLLSKQINELNKSVSGSSSDESSSGEETTTKKPETKVNIDSIKSKLSKKEISSRPNAKSSKHSNDTDEKR